MTTNPDDKKPKQVLATYAVIALIVMFLLNIFVLPGIMERSIRETTYSDFLKGIDSKQIQEVQFDVQDSIIYYTIKIYSFNNTNKLIYILQLSILPRIFPIN